MTPEQRIADLEAVLNRIAYPAYGTGFHGLRKIAREALYGKGGGKPGGNKDSYDAALAAHPKSQSVLRDQTDIPL